LTFNLTGPELICENISHFFGTNNWFVPSLSGSKVWYIVKRDRGQGCVGEAPQQEKSKHEACRCRVISLDSYSYIEMKARARERLECSEFRAGILHLVVVLFCWCVSDHHH
jgi:hypothetical protein